jgi:hypothetical protein
MDFKVTAEGKSVEAKVEIRATRFGVDVTDVLKRYDIPPTMIASGEGARNALNDRLDDLTAKREERAHTLRRDRLEHCFRRGG